MNKIKTFLILLCIFTLFASHISIPAALYQQNITSLFSYEKKQKLAISDTNLLSPDEIKKENYKTIHYLNQNLLGVSDYEKAQKELQQFNRPVIGIVGQDDDELSYEGYQRKIIGTSY